jgi:tetratricopeptide (TPR) repeat protein
MIVKNEAAVIRRCLDSVRPLIDAWCVVDTGSSDGTQEIVRAALGDLPGALHERPWRDFGHNRTEALDLARPLADYALLIDADEELVLPTGYRLPPLGAGAYLTLHRSGRSTMSFYRIQLVKCSLPWRYVGVLHEVITCDAAHEEAKLGEIECVGHFDGARNQGEARAKYAHDAEVLERALRDEPDNARYVFYLAQSYRDAGELEAAFATYRRRAQMGGWGEEVWYSLFQMGELSLQQGRNADAVYAWLQAFASRPTRREPLVSLARHYRQKKQYAAAYLFAKQAVGIERPGDTLFLQEDAYDWRADDELSVAAYWIGNHRESLEHADRALRAPSLPPAQRPRIEKNRQFAVDKLEKERT